MYICGRYLLGLFRLKFIYTVYNSKLNSFQAQKKKAGLCFRKIRVIRAVDIDLSRAQTKIMKPFCM